MGAGVSGWRLAGTVSRLGHLGVVSGTALDAIFSRRLQDGDRDGQLRRALSGFPVPSMADRVLRTYFVPGGRPEGHPYLPIPMASASPSRDWLELNIVANFAEVFLAKEGHAGLVGVNYLEKVQLHLLPSLYGAMLAGVDYVLIGAGIPWQIPGVLDGLAQHEPVSYRLNVAGAAPDDDFRIRFDPGQVMGAVLPDLKRPRFLAIIASTTLATALLKRASGTIDGFVIEGPPAGGHNAPPRGVLQLDDRGEPVYGLRDHVEPESMKRFGVPFWLAGRYGDPERIREALTAGAAGVQVGTAFAFCAESGMEPEVKSRILEKVREGEAVVHTDPVASPAGFPFKVAELEGSLSDKAVGEIRPRRCDLGYLRQLFKKEDGSLGYRCPGEPVDSYVKKAGKVEETLGRKCLCNGLLATIGLPQTRSSGYVERPIVTTGTDLHQLVRFTSPSNLSYTAEDVIRFLLPEERAFDES
jgi:nitronate monooxygenase